MKSFLLLIEVLTLLGLILAQSNVTNTTTTTTTTTISEECDVYYSIIGENDGSCCSSNTNPKEATLSHAECVNGHINKM